MTEFIALHKRKLVLGLLIALAFVGFKWLSGQKNKPVEADKKPVLAEVLKTTKKADTFVFGAWTPTEYREVLGEVSSDSDIEVKAEISGSVARVVAAVGKKVRAGQALAYYKTSGDPTAINYQSAVNNLESTRLSAQNSIRAAEIAVQNAEKSLAQTATQQNQNFNQSYDSLRLEAQAVETLIRNALDTVDKYVQFTPKYKHNQSLAYFQIGNTDTIRKQNIKNEGQQLTLKMQNFPLPLVIATEAQIVQDARQRLAFLQSLQALLASLEILLERTALNTRINEAQVNGFIQQVEGVSAALNGKVAAYQNQINGVSKAKQGSRSSVLGAQNQLENAKASLELAKAQAEAQIIAAKNQVNTAGAATADLTVRAPISGTITAKMVKVGDLLSPGLPLFTIVNESQAKKVVAYLSQDEWYKASKADNIEVEIGNQTLDVTDKYLSTQIDPRTQKLLAEFSIPAGTTLVGNLATVRIPLSSQTVDGESALVPFSAVSFEPDGAEVLIVNENQVTQRRKVVVGKVVVSNIEVLSGLKSGETVIEFYKRVLPGETIANGENDLLENFEREITSDDVLIPDSALELNLENHES